MSAAERVTAVIVHYETPDLLRTAAGSFLRACPGIPLLLVDNGSPGDGRAAVRELAAGHPGLVRAILNDANLHHGPAMDQALRALTTPFVLFLDSDCEVRDGSFLPGMLRLLEADPRAYAAGARIFMDRRGFDVAEGTAGATPYIRPWCMLVRRELYMALPPFERHGSPCLTNMTAAALRGYGLVAYPVAASVTHGGRGTAARHGYGLGLRGKWNHLLHRLGL